MKERLFPFIIALSALSVSASAAFYSVFGLSQLFAGASTQVMIMAGTLEVAKLVLASLLYQYWDKINKLLRTYFLIATFILMVITSGGIYGFLSGAYQETATQSEFMDRQVAIIELKQERFEETKGDLQIEKTALAKSISDLRIALSNPQQVQYVDKETGQLITTTSSSARRALQKELKTSINERDATDLRLNAVTDSIAALDVAILDAQINNESARELGPLKYMAELTGWAMSKVVNWFMILIIFVFDPLAIGMIVAANMAFAHVKGVARDPKDYEVYGNEVLYTEEDAEIFFDALENPQKPNENLKKAFENYSEKIKEIEPTSNMPSEDLKQRVKQNQKSLKKKETPKPKPKEEKGLLQGNLTKDIPKEEKPKQTPKNPTWGSPGGAR